MSRINLSKHKAELEKAWADLHRPDSKNDWVVFGYEGKTFDLKIVGTGEDGFEEMIDDLSGGKILYAGCRVNDPNTNLPKIVFVNWQGEGVPTNVKGTCANHLRDVNNLFRGAHVSINARSEDDLDYDDILEKVKKSSGSNYSVHKEKPRPAEKIKPVGAVYQRINPEAEINIQKRDTFWSQQERDEKARQEEERLRIEQERQNEDRKRKEREAKETAVREEAIRERSRSIDQQRAGQRALEQKKKDEERKRYEETLKDAERDDREFRSRSDSERRRRLQKLIWHKNVSSDYVVAGIFPVHYYSSGQGAFVFNRAGLTWVEAFLFAIDEINNNTQLLPGIKLGYALYDSCNHPNYGLQATLDIIQEPRALPAAPPAAASSNNNKPGFRYAAECKCNKTKPAMITVVGDAASSSSTRIASVLGARSVVMPQISYSSTSTALSNKNNYPSFLRTIPPDTFQALFIIDILKKFKWTYVSFIASDDAYGRLGVENLLPLLHKENLCVALTDVFDQTVKGRAKIESIVSKLAKDKRSMVVVLWCQYQQAEVFLQAAERHRYYDRTWIATETWGSNSLVTKINPRVVSGMLGIIPAAVKYQPFERYLSQLTPNHSVHNPWIEQYWNRQGCTRLPNGKYRCKDSAPIPDANSLPRNKYINVMDAVYAAAHGLHQILFGNNSSVKKSRVTGEQLLPYIKKINFTGKARLDVNFNENGDPGVASYSLTNLHQDEAGKLEFNIVGQWDSVSRKTEILAGAELMFANRSRIPPRSVCSDECTPGYYGLVYTSKSCCWTCVACPKNQVQPSRGKLKCNPCSAGTLPNDNKTLCITPKGTNFSIINAWGIIVLTVTMITIAMVVFVIVVIVFRWNTPLVRAWNRELSCIQLASIVMILLLPVLYLVRPSDSSCIARPFYFIIFYTISVSVTFTKTDRLLRIFKASNSGRLSKNSRVLNNGMQILTVVVLTLIASVICITFFFVFRPEFYEEINRDNGDVTVTYSCGKNYRALFLILLSYIFGIALTCNVFAFRARKLPENYNEARYTSFAMFLFCLSWLCFLPLFFSLQSESDKELAIMLVSYTSTAAMFFTLYGPKMYVILFHPEENTPERFRAKLKAAKSINRSHSGSSPSQKRRTITSHSSTQKEASPQSHRGENLKRNPAFEPSVDHKEAQHLIKGRQTMGEERKRFDAPAQEKAPPPTVPKKAARKPVPVPVPKAAEPEPVEPEPSRPEPVEPEPVEPEPVEPEPVEPEPVEPEPVSTPAEPLHVEKEVEQQPEQPVAPQDQEQEPTNAYYEAVDDAPTQPEQPTPQYNSEELAREEEPNLYDTVTEDNPQSSAPVQATSPAGMTVKAVYDYQAEGEDEISFDPGDLITNVEAVDEGWWKGAGPDGRFGLFPANYVEVVSDGAQPSEQQAPAVEESQAPTQQGLTARALYDYQASDETEITFDPNDIITNIEQIDEGWWRGTGPNGDEGLFPANYVELIS
eukprot:gene5307-5976_t